MTTLMFCTPFMRAVRKCYGSVTYWGLGLISATLFWAAKMDFVFVFFMSLWISLGAQMFGERYGYRWWVSGLFGLLLGSLVGFTGTYLLLQSYGITSQQSMAGLLQDFLTMSQLSQAPLKVTAKDLLPIIPGLFMVIIEFALGMGLIFEKRVFQWFDLPRERYVSQANLLESRLPDGLIWFSLVVIFFAFVDLKSEPLRFLGINLLYVFGVLYFFQGLAIIESFLKAIKAGIFGRGLIYFLLVGQLLPLVALMGFVDFWIDFRKKIRIAVVNSKKSEQ